jgi:hypothetical protein
MKLFKILIPGLAVFCIGCENPATENTTQSKTKTDAKTLFINSALVDCFGVAPQKCMQIRRNENEEWELFYNEIENFTFEEGFFYELAVDMIDVKNQAADASSPKYRLVKIISKKKA